MDSFLLSDHPMSLEKTGYNMQKKGEKKKNAHLFHPEGEGALPGVFLLQVQVCVEEDEVNVALQVLQAPQQRLLTLALHFTAFDLKNKRGVREHY